jgi:hypothetical protein
MLSRKNTRNKRRIRIVPELSLMKRYQLLRRDKMSQVPNINSPLKDLKLGKILAFQINNKNIMKMHKFKIKM